MPNFEGKPNFGEAGPPEEENLSMDALEHRLEKQEAGKDVERGQDNKPEEEKHPEIFARTFEEAKEQEKRFSDKFILDALNNLDREISWVKRYFDNVSPDRFETEAMHSPEEIARIHEKNSDLIAKNLKINMLGNFGEEAKTFLTEKKQRYIDKLQQNNAVWEESLKNYYAGEDEHIKNVASGEYRGFLINSKEGEVVDISDAGHSSMFSGVRPNIKIQDQMVAKFIFWETSARAEEKLKGEAPEDQRRIYLNPKTESLTETFDNLMHALDERGLSVQAKMLDRSFEFARNLRQEEPGDIRGDSIVVYMPEDVSDEVLDVVLSIYEESPDIFDDRSLPKVPAKIAPGIAVGDEPLVSGTSLTSNRANFIEQVLRVTKEEKLGIKFGQDISPDKQEEAIKVFNQTLEELAEKYNIDPHNFAFNFQDKESSS